MNSLLYNKLLVFTSTRKIRDFYDNSNDEILPFTMTLAEFLKRAIYVDDKSECDDISKILFMRDAATTTKRIISQLGFPEEFYEFMKNSDYLFSFFKELKTHQKNITDLRYGDEYSAYDEHLTILEELLNRYLEILHTHGYYDEISICDEFKINRSFLKRYDEIEIYIDGFLSEFEFKIILQALEFTNINLHFRSSNFNKKIIKKLSDITDLKFDEGYVYTINLNDKTIIKCDKFEISNTIVTKKFPLRTLQCAYVFEKISSFLDDGIAPEKIAVVLPDEEFGEILKLHDENNLLNFAMGINFKNTLFYELVFKICEAIKEDINPSFTDLENFKFDEYSLFFREISLKKELFDNIKFEFEKTAKYEKFKFYVDELIILCKNDEKHQIWALLSPVLFSIQKLLESSNELSFKNIFELFLLKISSIKIPHVGGGKVAVLGILESRGIKFDGVIVLDFNDDLIPSRSSSEMFLSSKVRENAGLIGREDRENLQRFYYEWLIYGAKKVAISYLENDEKIPSRFLKNFSTKDDEEFQTQAYLDFFLKKGRPPLLKTDEIIKEKHDFFATALSFSRLNTYLKCKRKYYYKYVAKILEDKNFVSSYELIRGNVFHESLQEFYENTEAKNFDAEKIAKIYLSKARKNGISEFDIQCDILKFKKFAPQFILHEKEFRFQKAEVELNSEFCGVKITGKIDRIDVGENGLCVIDYKSGAADKKSLQLPFYEALLKKECEKKFFSFKSGEFLSSEATLSDLEQIIEEIKSENLNEIEFYKNEKSCKNCPYSVICKGENGLEGSK